MQGYSTSIYGNNYIQTYSFSLHKTLIDGLWITCDVFISCPDSYPDGTHSLEDPLVSKWCNDTFSKYVLMNKQSHLHFGWPECKLYFPNWSFLMIDVIAVRICNV